MDQLCHGVAPWFEIKDVLTGDSFWVLQYYILVGMQFCENFWLWHGSYEVCNGFL